MRVAVRVPCWRLGALEVPAYMALRSSWLPTLTDASLRPFQAGCKPEDQVRSLVNT